MRSSHLLNADQLKSVCPPPSSSLFAGPQTYSSPNLNINLPSFSSHLISGDPRTSFRPSASASSSTLCTRSLNTTVSSLSGVDFGFFSLEIHPAELCYLTVVLSTARQGQVTTVASWLLDHCGKLYSTEEILGIFSRLRITAYCQSTKAPLLITFHAT